MGVSPDRVKRTVIFDRKSDVTKKEQCYKVLSGEKSVTNGEQPYKGRTVLLMENNLTKERQCYKWRTALQRKDSAINGEQSYKGRTLLQSTIRGEKRYKWRTTLQRKDSAINGEQGYKGRTMLQRENNVTLGENNATERRTVTC